MGFSLRFLCVLFLIPAFLPAQSSFYSRFEGNIGPDHAIMHLNRMPHDVEACLYIFKSETHQDVKQFTLVGNVDGQGLISLHEPADTVEIFVGKLGVNRLEGAWQAEHGLMQMARFEAQYPSGSLKLSLQAKEATIRLDDQKSDSPKASFEMSLLWPDDQHTTTLVKLLYAWLLPAGDTLASEQLSSEFILDATLEQFRASYQQLSGATNTDSPTFYWIRSEQQQVLVNEYDLLCIERASYAYTGGAHGIENFRYLLIDHRKNLVLNRENLFLPESDSMLSVLITNTFKKIYKVPLKQSLTEFGLFGDAIPANDNIFINYTGIGFYFNSYEIAPYAFGQSKIVVPFEKMLPLMTEFGQDVAARMAFVIEHQKSPE